MGVSRGASLEELEALYRARYSQFVRVATVITGSLESGRDVVHEAFVAAVRSRQSFRHEAPLGGWVWRLLVNQARKHRGRDRSNAHAERDLIAEPVMSEPSPLEGVLSTRAVVAMLPERQRLVLFLRYYADLDYNAIAAALDIRPGTVGATLNAAHAALRRHLEEVPRRARS